MKRSNLIIFAGILTILSLTKLVIEIILWSYFGVVMWGALFLASFLYLVLIITKERRKKDESR